jgi:hypothetical protein
MMHPHNDTHYSRLVHRDVGTHLRVGTQYEYRQQDEDSFLGTHVSKYVINE